MSCEPGRRAAYSSDLRHRIVWQRIAMELPFRTIAHNLSISVGTVYNVCKLFEQTGHVDPRKQDCTTLRAMTEYDEVLVIGLYLGEICSQVRSIIGQSLC